MSSATKNYLSSLDSYCFNKNFSCVACCGIFNLNFSDSEREAWLAGNSKDFLLLDLHDRLSLRKYRMTKEKEIEDKKIREDIYVCPFLGLLQKNKAGCLLHPQGRLHPQISNLPHPQNFSFYGESICQNYFCPSAEKKMIPASFFSWLNEKKESLSFLDISRLVAHSFAWRIFSAMKFTSVAEEKKFFEQRRKNFQEKNLPVTSFETWVVSDEQLKHSSRQNLKAVLKAIETKENYLHDQLKIDKASYEKN